MPKLIIEFPNDDIMQISLLHAIDPGPGGRLIDGTYEFDRGATILPWRALPGINEIRALIAGATRGHRPRLQRRPGE